MPDLSGFVAQKAFEITLKSDHITQEHTARLTHYHNTFEVMFLLASENIFFIKDTPLQTARGHMILIPPYTVHNIEYKIHTDYTRYVLYFEAAFVFPLVGHYINRPELAGIFRIRLGVKRDFLPFVQALEAVARDGGKVHKNITRTIVVGDKAKTLLRVKPFYCTCIHSIGTS